MVDQCTRDNAAKPGAMHIDTLNAGASSAAHGAMTPTELMEKLTAGELAYG
jgi:hypothetical protein